jgi:hypothetical protein
MKEIMYDQSSFLIAAVLLASMLAAIEFGYHMGARAQARASEPQKGQVNAVQAALLGVLALLLGFTFSLALQRHDSRSAAVVDEANAIGTAWLRTDLLPEPVRADAKKLMRRYVDLRVEASTVALDDPAARTALTGQSSQVSAALWSAAVRAVELDPRPATSGLFMQAMNEMIDAYGRRDAALARHVPEIVLFLLYGTFLLTGGIVGYASGISGHRSTFATYIMVSLIVLLVFIIIDLDRPRRGLVEVSQQSLLDLQASMR